MNFTTFKQLEIINGLTYALFIVTKLIIYLGFKNWGL